MSEPVILMRITVKSFSSCMRSSVLWAFHGAALSDDTDLAAKQFPWNCHGTIRHAGSCEA
jgi:hypothetical protein